MDSVKLRGKRPTASVLSMLIAGSIHQVPGGDWPGIAAMRALEARRREDEEANTPAVRCRAYTPRTILIRCGLSDPSIGSYR